MRSTPVLPRLAPALAAAIAVALAGCGADGSAGQDAPGVSNTASADVAVETTRPTTATTDPASTTTAGAGEQSWFPAAGDGVGEWTVVVEEVVEHDSNAFTQGLELAGTRLLESTGLYGESSIRVVDPYSGEVLASSPLPDEVFGEGLTVVEDRVVQLTWREGRAFVWDLETLQQVGEYSYGGEGWGLCDNGTHLVMSDGTSTLTLRDRAGFDAVAQIDVRRDQAPVTFLNELECVDDQILANVWMTAEIVVIDLGTGQVSATIDATSLVADARQRAGTAEIDHLNGIAALGDGRFLLTGKYWPSAYVVRVVEKAN